ncbi:tetratricopeptide repeat protein [Spirulina major CS-329]|uniref:tetratricopeptide repeat protein n=1 Tax=Spirulina TaxID=1154 RepID=UPI00232F0EB0|nr:MULTISPECIES: tetratricopeptide repeat protein [Spirulina]MDB9493155.1 tetratricopeptide repeat protein [Spirulina subsalsa CS-330]MDB9502293.1 tetratricopeptide repeat protein [Spirulina major CS-329]
MLLVDPEKIHAQNENAYDDLIVTVTASHGVLSLFLAVCDDAIFRESIIQRYEVELAPTIKPYRARLSQKEPSLRQALDTVFNQHLQLKMGERAMITVLGADALLPLILGNEKRSEQAQFLGYLQWTRESLREFKCPIVLWVTSRLLAAVGRDAPDFWGWRKDVFRFQTLPKPSLLQLRNTQESISFFEETDEAGELPIEELQALIAQRETLDHPQDDAILATLYFQMGEAYARQSKRTGAATHKGSVAEAIAWYNKAARLQEHQGRDRVAWATTLNNLAALNYTQGKYEEAEPLYLQALEIVSRALGEDHPEVATTLNNLAGLYYVQGKYEQAEPLYLQALEIVSRALGEDHPEVATTLNNLAELYRVQGKYEQAEPLFLQALEMKRRMPEKDHTEVATTLNNLAGLYCVQGKYEQAEPLYLQALEIVSRALGEDHPKVATTLNNLAGLYYVQGQYEKSESLYLQSLEMRRRSLGEDHPEVATTLNNLAELYCVQGKYEQAEPFYLQAILIAVQSLGEQHPNTQKFFNNFVPCVIRAIRANRTLSNHPLTQNLLQQIRDNEA